MVMIKTFLEGYMPNADIRHAVGIFVSKQKFCVTNSIRIMHLQIRNRTNKFANLFLIANGKGALFCFTPLGCVNRNPAKAKVVLAGTRAQ